jgi:type II secretory pathway component PulK
MVDIAMLGVGVLDRLIQLLTVDRRNREKYFEQFIEPLYKDAESVMNDYVGLFTELIGLLKKTDSTEEVIEWIEQRRSKMLPMRIKVRALLDNNTVNPKKGDYLLDSTTPGLHHGGGR